MPTAAELKAEIEGGPLAAALAPFWAAVFPSEPEPDPADAAAHARWGRIRHRFGALTPDAADGIARVLNDPARRARAVTTLSRGAFLAAVAPLVLTLVTKDATTREKWAVILNLLTGGDESVNVGRAQVQGMIAVAVQDGLLDAAGAAALSDLGTEPCSRAAELGWGYVTPDQAAAAKAVA